MNGLRILFNRLPFLSIRSRILMIALLPALLAEFGMATYYTTQSLANAEDALHARAASAVRQLANALPYTLASGDSTRTAALLESEIKTSHLAFIRVTDVHGRLLGGSGDRALATAEKPGYYQQRREIRLPADHFGDVVYVAENGPLDDVLGYAEVGVSLDQIETFKRATLSRSAISMLLAMALTAVLAWRLSDRLASQLKHIGHVVEQLACHDLTVRAQLPVGGEIGTLAAGVNNMAEALQAHRRELEQRIYEATADLAAEKDMAERAHQAKSRFFAAASHDLRQPLHALSLFVAALKARNHQVEAQTLIENIEASTAAMALLFNALLDISRLDAGAVEVHRVHFPLQNMLRDLEQQFGAVTAEKQLRLRFRSCELALFSDPLLIERILGNLIANAIRYTDDGGVLIACRRHCGMVRLSVIDTGRGIPPEQQESVFQEFVQLHNPARNRSNGLGLGLAIVSRLGQLLGHRVHLRSRPGHGSVFSIDVPLGQTQRVHLPDSAAGEPVLIPGDALVLLVDDESGILRGMAELFDNWAIDLVTARSADEAEQWLDSLGRAPDVIVSDYRLPGDRDGLDIIARLRKKYGRDIPAVLVTGDTAPDTILRIKQAGFPLMHKPLRPAKLRSLLTHLIQQTRAPAVG